VKAKAEDMDPIDALYISAAMALLDADLKGFDREYHLLRETLYKEEVGAHMTDCLLEMKEDDFKRLTYLLADLKKVIEREREKAVGEEPAVISLCDESNKCSSTKQLTMLFRSQRDKYSNYEDFKEHVMPSIKEILEKAESEGAENRYKCVASRMHCLGFPLHTIIRITGCAPEVKEPEKGR
jgi:hypothetical protein